ncbi:hypothetical protein HDU87_002352 [Geranomyces variabilis]|uniref:GDS1 winged helix domain-containing protein n=1 Tax=Geranomyces variabilis TaxID=109894 RepID=A0AAD5XRZ3_9FUNG|nr:hypothetical protein HDU87_002352 [Geranomyces variabilis]
MSNEAGPSTGVPAQRREMPAEVNVDVHPEDHRDKVFMAVMSTLIMNSNRPMTPRELAAFILKYKITTLGGQTPYATVSSRISQHFKRSTEGARAPLLGKQAIIEPNRKTVATTPRKWRYYVDPASTGVPLGDDVGPVEDIPLPAQAPVASKPRAARATSSLSKGRRTAPYSPPPSVASSSRTTHEDSRQPSEPRTREHSPELQQQPSPAEEEASIRSFSSPESASENGGREVEHKQSRRRKTKRAPDSAPIPPDPTAKRRFKK